MKELVAQISDEQKQILKRTLFKGFSDDEVNFCLAVCNRTGHDPFLRQIHFNKRKNRKSGDETIVITTGIDGFRLTADRSRAYAGSDEATFDLNEKGLPIKGTMTVYKMVQGVRCAFTASARWDEFYPGDGPDGFMWRKMPFVMLGKCVEAQALRRAFPAELSNVYAPEEMQQAASNRQAIKTRAQDVQAVIEAAQIPDLEVEADFITEAAAADPSIGDYVIKAGGYKGKRLRDLTPKILERAILNLDSMPAPLHMDLEEYREKAMEYLNSLEEAP